MNEGIQRWLSLHPLPRYAMLLVGALGLWLLCWALLLRPLRLERQDVLAVLEKQQQRLQQRQNQLSQHPLPETLHDQLAQISAQLHTVSSTPALERLLAMRGQQLEQWLPEAQPRTLILHLQWTQFQPLFAELAQAAVPFPQRFQLAMQQAHLVAELWLEHGDAS